jgi:hypothetical protein
MNCKEFGRKWPWSNFKVLSCHLPGGTEESHKTLSQDSWSLGQDLNLGPPECKAGWHHSVLHYNLHEQWIILPYFAKLKDTMRQYFVSHSYNKLTLQLFKQCYRKNNEQFWQKELTISMASEPEGSSPYLQEPAILIKCTNTVYKPATKNVYSP